jgi:hypothetical protein
MKHTTKSVILWLSVIIAVIAIISGCGDKSDPLGANPIYSNPTEEAPPADNEGDGDPSEEIIESTEEPPPADNEEDGDPSKEIIEPTEEAPPADNEEDGDPSEEIIEPTEEAPPADKGEDGDPIEGITEPTEEAPPTDNEGDGDPIEEIIEPTEEPPPEDNESDGDSIEEPPPATEEPFETVPLFNTLTALGLWLKTQPPNTAETPYKITLTASGITDLKTTLAAAPDKYVHIDFTGSAMTTIPSYFLQSCNTLAGLTIPNSVTKIENYAFYGCDSLTAVIFESVITTGNFGSTGTFPGDLRTKYLIGGKGTYTRTNGSNSWSKE